MLSVFDVGRTLRSKRLCNGRVSVRPSVRPSVCPLYRQRQRCAVGLLITGYLHHRQQPGRGQQISTDSCRRDQRHVVIRGGGRTQTCVAIVFTLINTETGIRLPLPACASVTN